jgi:TonB family protein
MLGAKQNRLLLFLTLSLLVHILFLCIRSQETALAPIKAFRTDHDIRISLKRVIVEGPSHVLMEQKIIPHRARPADIKPVPTVVKRIFMPARMHIQNELLPPIQTLTQHSRADSVLFDTRQKASTLASGDSHAEETYFSRIRRLLEAAKQYPESARRGGIEGSVGISFRINRQGYLVRNIEVFRSSGSPALDQASIACVKKVDKFPPLPDIFKEDFLKIRVHLVFKLRGES